jgi:hypothetical protein
MAAFASLLLVLACQLFLSIRRLSQTFDEATHLFAGYQYWHARDFGVNPEHPPLAKLVAAVPIMQLPLTQPRVPPMHFKYEAYIGGAQLLYQNDADALLWRARVAVSVFTFVLALLVFAAGWELFGRWAALLALCFYVFEPNILAHSALVTTDVPLTCCLFAAVYMFYRYIRKQTVSNLVICGCAVGLTLASKHSGLVILPILVLLALTELLTGGYLKKEKLDRRLRKQHALRTVVALAVIGVIGFVILWAFYSFRFEARPGGASMNPPLGAFTDTRMIWVLARGRLLPEAYLYGLADVLGASTEGRPSFLMGTLYPSGQWFYFPAAFVIKSTLAFLLLLLIVPFIKMLSSTAFRRECTFLLLPSLTVFALSMISHLNIGLRHILPVYPFLIVLAAGAAWVVATRRRVGLYMVAGLVLFHATSSLHAFPNYLTYSNEAFGGPSNTYRFLTDSNVDWGQGLKQVRSYLAEQQIKDCWFAFFQPFVNPAYYHIPCRPLPSSLTVAFGLPVQTIPPTVQGTVLVSASEASGYFWGPGDMNPYHEFQSRRPDGIIGNSILVFRGTFALPLASAVSHAALASRLLKKKELEPALSEAQTAVTLAPQSAQIHALLGGILMTMGRVAEAEHAFRAALDRARTQYPEHQAVRVQNMITAFKGR